MNSSIGIRPAIQPWRIAASPKRRRQTISIMVAAPPTEILPPRMMRVASRLSPAKKAV
jgi:hypothetical protein